MDMITPPWARGEDEVVGTPCPPSTCMRALPVETPQDLQDGRLLSSSSTLSVAAENTAHNSFSKGFSAKKGKGEQKRTKDTRKEV
ncbi:hypothetical protein MC885_008497 [Smutsia gigantea]|nr:hypothetical protein MC885_008497 [Smutsia gigantea]